jgi:hypothetical protein
VHFFAFNGMSILFAAIGVSMVVRAFRGGGGGGRGYRDLQPPPPVMLEDPRVPQLQTEMDELRQQVDRLSAAESFYAQLQAPKPPAPPAS